MDATLNQVASVGGISATSTVSRSSDGGDGRDPTLLAAAAGSLTTRTDDNTGQITVTSHTINPGETVDVGWVGGRRRGMTVTATSGTTITVDGGSGDVLPAQDTAVTCAEQETVEMDFDGTALTFLVVQVDYRASIEFQDSGGSALKSLDLAAGEMFAWVSDQGTTTPVNGTVDRVKCSSLDPAGQTPTVKIGTLLDTTPATTTTTTT